MSRPGVWPLPDALLVAVTVPVVEPAAALQIANGAGWLLGWCLTETSGAGAASLTLYDGQSAESPLLAELAIASGAVLAAVPGMPGFPFAGGLWGVPSGALTGSLTIAHIAAL